MSRIAISPLVTQTRVIHANIACMPQACFQNIFCFLMKTIMTFR